MIDILKSLLYSNTSVIWKPSAVSQWCCYLTGHVSLASLPMAAASFMIANCLGHCRYEFLLNKIYKTFALECNWLHWLVPGHKFQSVFCELWFKYLFSS